jgi:hypothetical protein
MRRIISKKSKTRGKIRRICSKKPGQSPLTGLFQARSKAYASTFITTKLVGFLQISSKTARTTKIKTCFSLLL